VPIRPEGSNVQISGLSSRNCSEWRPSHLLVSDEVDTERLDRRAHEEGLTRALRELRKLTADVEAGRVVEEWEIAELGNDIEGQSYSADDEQA
jgi:hypothetical protein